MSVVDVKFDVRYEYGVVKGRTAVDAGHAAEHNARRRLVTELGNGVTRPARSSSSSVGAAQSVRGAGGTAVPWTPEALVRELPCGCGGRGGGAAGCRWGLSWAPPLVPEITPAWCQRDDDDHCSRSAMRPLLRTGRRFEASTRGTDTADPAAVAEPLDEPYRRAVALIAHVTHAHDRSEGDARLHVTHRAGWGQAGPRIPVPLACIVESGNKMRRGVDTPFGQTMSHVSGKRGRWWGHAARADFGARVGEDAK
eukprot:gene8389-biopygen5489